LIEYLMAVADAAVSRGKVVTVVVDVDIQPRDLRRRRRAADAVLALCMRLCRTDKREYGERRDARLTQGHWSPRRRPRCARARSRCCGNNNFHREPREARPVSAGHNLFHRWRGFE